MGRVDPPKTGSGPREDSNTPAGKVDTPEETKEIEAKLKAEEESAKVEADKKAKADKKANKPKTMEERMEELALIVNAQDEKQKESNRIISELNKKLDSVSDIRRLEAFNLKSRENLNVKKIKLWKYNGKIVLAWSRMLTNNVYKKDNKTYVEELSTELIYEDGEKEIVNYVRWQGDKKQHDVVLKLDSTDPATGVRIITVVDAEGNEFNVEDKFVN